MANLILNQPGTDIVWQDTGSSPTHIITLTSLATTVARQGVTHDFGATTARSRLFSWRAWVQFDTNPVVDEQVDIYLKTSDGTTWDNDDAEGDADVSALLKLKNCHLLKSIIVDEAVLDVTMSASGVIEISAQEVAPIFHNATVDSLRDVANVHGFRLRPVPDEVQ